MKNSILSAQDEIIDALRQLARKYNVMVNERLRVWAVAWVARKGEAEYLRRINALQSNFETILFTSQRKYSREEMNKR